MKIYEVTWWTRSPLVRAAIRARPSLLDDLEHAARSKHLVSTRDAFWTSVVGWSNERIRIQNDILRAAFATVGPPSVAPAAVFLLGVPGSGKSSVLRPMAIEALAAIDSSVPLVRDADEIRVQLPEYSGGRGSGVVQEETADVAYIRGEGWIPADRHLLIDTVGDSRWLPAEIRRFHGSGRQIVVLCTEVSIDIAIERAMQRAVDTGRVVPIDYLRGCDGRPRAALEAALAGGLPIARWAVVNTESRVPAILEHDGSFSPPT